MAPSAVASHASEQEQGPLPHPAVAGLTLSVDGHLHVPQQLKKLVDTRNEWVQEIGEAIEKREKEAPGTFYGLPRSSVYESLDLPPDPQPKLRSVKP